MGIASNAIGCVISKNKLKRKDGHVLAHRDRRVREAREAGRQRHSKGKAEFQGAVAEGHACLCGVPKPHHE